MMMKQGFSSFYISVAGMILALYGLIFDVSVAVWIGLVLITVERIALQCILWYAKRIQRKIQQAMYEQMKVMADTVIKQSQEVPSVMQREKD